MHLLVLVAGTNDPSNSDVLADAFIEGCRGQSGAAMEKVRLKDLEIAHFDISYYDAKTDQGKDFLKLKASIEKSHGIVFASPIWNFDVPAHLKNLIDRIGSFALDGTRSIGQLKGKPFFLIYTGGTPAAAWYGIMRKTTSSMNEAIKFFGGTVMGSHYEPRCTKGKGVFGLVVNQRPESLALMKKKGAEFAAICAEYARNGKLPMVQSLTHAFYQFGGRIKKLVGL